MFPVVDVLFELVAKFVAVGIVLTDLLVFADAVHTVGRLCAVGVVRRRRGASRFDSVRMV